MCDVGLASTPLHSVVNLRVGTLCFLSWTAAEHHFTKPSWRKDEKELRVNGCHCFKWFWNGKWPVDPKNTSVLGNFVSTQSWDPWRWLYPVAQWFWRSWWGNTSCPTSCWCFSFIPRTPVQTKRVKTIASRPHPWISSDSERLQGSH